MSESPESRTYRKQHGFLAEFRLWLVSLALLWIVLPLIPDKHPSGRLLLELLVEWGELKD